MTTAAKDWAQQLLNDESYVTTQAFVDKLSTRERKLVCDELEAIAVTAAWLAGYVEMRYGAGCGDQGHADAVKAANRVRSALRKALGYSITKPIWV